MSGILRFQFAPAQASLFSRLAQLAIAQMQRRQDLVAMRCRRVGGCMCVAAAPKEALMTHVALEGYHANAEERLDAWDAVINKHRTCRRYDALPLS